VRQFSSSRKLVLEALGRALRRNVEAAGLDCAAVDDLSSSSLSAH